MKDVDVHARCRDIEETSQDRRDLETNSSSVFSIVMILCWQILSETHAYELI